MERNVGGSAVEIYRRLVGMPVLGADAVAVSAVVACVSASRSRMR